jgi:hypothetical protein
MEKHTCYELPQSSVRHGAQSRERKWHVIAYPNQNFQVENLNAKISLSCTCWKDSNILDSVKTGFEHLPI